MELAVPFETLHADRATHHLESKMIDVSNHDKLKSARGMIFFHHDISHMKPMTWGNRSMEPHLSRLINGAAQDLFPRPRWRQSDADARRASHWRTDRFSQIPRKVITVFTWVGRLGEGRNVHNRLSAAFR